MEGCGDALKLLPSGIQLVRSSGMTREEVRERVDQLVGRDEIQLSAATQNMLRKLDDLPFTHATAPTRKRLRNAFARANFIYVGDLVVFHMSELRRLPGIGRVCVIAIMDELSLLDLTLGMSEDDARVKQFREMCKLLSK